MSCGGQLDGKPDMYLLLSQLGYSTVDTYCFIINFFVSAPEEQKYGG